MSSMGARIEALERRAAYVQASIEARNGSDGVLGYLQGEADALAWALPILRHAKATDGAEARDPEKQRVYDGWRAAAKALAFTVQARLGSDALGLHKCQPEVRAEIEKALAVAQLGYDPTAVPDAAPT